MPVDEVYGARVDCDICVKGTISTSSCTGLPTDLLEKLEREKQQREKKKKLEKSSEDLDPDFSLNRENVEPSSKSTPKVKPQNQKRPCSSIKMRSVIAPKK